MKKLKVTEQTLLEGEPETVIRQTVCRTRTEFPSLRSKRHCEVNRKGGVSLLQPKYTAFLALTIKPDSEEFCIDRIWRG